jgi:hypothetical protein
MDIPARSGSVGVVAGMRRNQSSGLVRVGQVCDRAPIASWSSDSTGRLALRPGDPPLSGRAVSRQPGLWRRRVTAAVRPTYQRLSRREGCFLDLRAGLRRLSAPTFGHPHGGLGVALIHPVLDIRATARATCARANTMPHTRVRRGTSMPSGVAPRYPRRPSARQPRPSCGFGGSLLSLINHLRISSQTEI